MNSTFISPTGEFSQELPTYKFKNGVEININGTWDDPNHLSGQIIIEIIIGSIITDGESIFIKSGIFYKEYSLDYEPLTQAELEKWRKDNNMQGKVLSK